MNHSSGSGTYEQLPLYAFQGSGESEQRRYQPLFQTWTTETLSREFLLTPADHLQIQRCIGSHNRLGFALHLAILRFLSVPLPSFDLLPDSIVRFISLQVGIDSAVLGSYAQRPQTRDDHLARIRTYLGLRSYNPTTDTEHLRQYLIQRALHRDDRTILLEEAEAWLRRHHIVFPAVTTLQTLLVDVIQVANTHFYTAVVSVLSPSQREHLGALLDHPHPKRNTLFAWLKEASRTASVQTLRDVLEKRRLLLELGIDTHDLQHLNRNRVRQCAYLGRKYHAATMRGFSPDKQATILLCLLQERLTEITDDIIDMVDSLIGRLFTDAEKERNMMMTAHGKELNRYLRHFRTVVAVILDSSIADSDIRTVAFTHVPAEVLDTSMKNSAPMLQPDDYNVFHFLDSRYTYLRSFLRPVFKALSFTGTASAQPFLDAWQFLQSLEGTTPMWKKLPRQTPTTFVPERWKKVVIHDDGSINHRMWMVCLAETLRNGLRSSDILVPGSRQHRDWRSYLHTERAWEERRSSWFADEWHGGAACDVYLTHLRTLFDATVARVESTWNENPFARIDHDRLVLSKDEKMPIPPRAQALRNTVAALLPRVKLPDVLMDVEQWVGFRHLFTHPNEPTGGSWSVRTETLDTAIFAVLVAQGCNLALSTMAEAADIPYHQLIHTSDWYVREECLRQAIVRVVDYHHTLPLAATFGPGTAAMSDGIRFGVTARSLHARAHPKLPVRGKGMTLYDMTTDQGSHPYIDSIRCTIREGSAALDAALHHETELPLKEHMTDTHGYTDMIFGLFELQSRIFSPRIRDVPSQVLYPLTPDHKKGMLGKLFRGPILSLQHIQRHWDEMHRIAASLKDGTVTAQLLVSKLQRLKRQSGGHKGIQE